MSTQVAESVFEYPSRLVPSPHVTGPLPKGRGAWKGVQKRNPSRLHPRPSTITLDHSLLAHQSIRIVVHHVHSSYGFKTSSSRHRADLKVAIQNTINN